MYGKLTYRKILYIYCTVANLARFATGCTSETELKNDADESLSLLTSLTFCHNINLHCRLMNYIDIVG